MGKIPVRREWDTEQDSQHEMQLMVVEWLADFPFTPRAASGGEAACFSEVTLKKCIKSPLQSLRRINPKGNKHPQPSYSSLKPALESSLFHFKIKLFFFLVKL